MYSICNIIPWTIATKKNCWKSSDQTVITETSRDCYKYFHHVDRRRLTIKNQEYDVKIPDSA